MAEAATLIGVREPVILTVDNGGTNTRVARGAESITAIEAYTTPQSYRRAIAKMGESAYTLLGGKRPDIVGISAAGKIVNGVIVSAGNLQKYGWTGLPFAQDVAAELGVEPERVVVINDCAAGAWAEREGRQLESEATGAFMVQSTGFGGALYSSSEIIADEPGHHYLKPGAVCADGQEGHMEAHIGGAGIARKWNLPDTHTNGQTYLLHSDPRWQEVKSDLHESMARTLVRYENDSGRALRVIGFTGSVALRGPTMLGDLQRHLNEDARTRGKAPDIKEAVYGEESGLYGAMFAARQLSHQT